MTQSVHLVHACYTPFFIPEFQPEDAGLFAVHVEKDRLGELAGFFGDFRAGNPSATG